MVKRILQTPGHWQAWEAAGDMPAVRATSLCLPHYVLVQYYRNLALIPYGACSHLAHSMLPNGIWTLPR